MLCQCVRGLRGPAVMYMVGSASNKLDGHIITSLLITENSVVFRTVSDLQASQTRAGATAQDKNVLSDNRVSDRTVVFCVCVYLWHFIVTWPMCADV